MSANSDNNTEENSDPLEHAPVGETTTQEFEQTLSPYDPLYREFGGTDRHFEAEIADIDVVETDGSSPEIKISWEVDVTKTLPFGWDRTAGPSSVEDTGLRGRIIRSLSPIARAISFVAALLVSGFLSIYIMNQMAGVTMNGEPVTVPADWQMWLLVVSIGIIAWVIKLGLEGLFPSRGVRR